MRTSWNALALTTESLALIAGFVEQNRNWATDAEKRFKAGEITALEKATAYNQYYQLVLKKEALESDFQIHQSRLQQWIGGEASIDWETIRLDKISGEDLLLSEVMDHPELTYNEQQSQIMKRQQSLEKGSFLPDFSIGYINQQIEGVGGLEGFQFGVGVPIFFWTQLGKVQAAKIESQIALAELEGKTIQLQSQLKETTIEVEKYKRQLDWF